MRAPVEQPGAGVEVPVAAPAALRRIAGCTAATGPGRARGPSRTTSFGGVGSPGSQACLDRRACRPRRTASGACRACRVRASLHGRLEVGHAPALGAGLEDPAGLADRVVELLAEVDGQAAGLLAVDVLAGLGRQHRRRRVPAVAGGDQHGVDVGPVEQLAEVAVDACSPCCRNVHPRVSCRRRGGSSARRRWRRTARRQLRAWPSGRTCSAGRCR